MKQMSQKILIVGGGIAGLTLLACLEKRGVKATLIERAPKFETIGYVIGLFPNGLSVLKYLGLDKEMIEKSEILENYVIRNMAGAEIWSCPMASFGGDLPCLEMERSVLQIALLERNAGADIRTNTTVTELHADADAVQVTFSDGTKDSYDMVIGTDGINSQIRATVDPRRRQRYAGFTYWMTYMPTAPDVSHNITNYIGHRKLLGTFPSRSSQGMMVFFGTSAAAHEYDKKAPLQSLFGEFAAINPAIASILKNLPSDPAHNFHHDDNELRSKIWYKDRLVLAGDAVHAFSPLLGMGASMAMEDAYVLAEEITTNENHSVAFAKYAARRKVRIAKLARHSTLLHKLLTSRFLSGALQPLLFSWFGGPSYQRLVRELVQERP
jgi:2-polyprenyl-6-methoxyphenol hydroxylase-like FAD-dependent oxidoreductase